ncbi:MAG: 3-phosphoglycerate dehydrogenase [Kiritimatiellae bacterium]|nr:3-phosphoglycerate dehydrogenase [Kiritimatiellia bacterium]
MATNYACLNPIAAVGLDRLGDGYGKTDDVAAADVIFVRSAKMDEIAPSPKLKAVARAGAGVNNIPHADYAKKGVVVFNTPGANANGVKELVIAAMLLASRDIVGGIEWVKENKGDENIAKSAEKAKKAFAGTEILGKTLGVLGLGAIGRKIAAAAQALGMDVIGYDPFVKELEGVKVVANVDEIYKVADFITIHVPALPDTKGMVNAEAIAKMKDGVIIINAARDVLANEADVLAAIKSGKVRKYVSDFPNTTTAGQDGVIVIPHLGASTEEAEDNCAVMAADEIKDFIENGNIRNSVNYPAVSLGPKAALRIAVCHTAEAAGAVEAALAGAASIAAKTRGDVGYTLAEGVRAEVAAIEAIPGVLKVRTV